MITFIKMLKPFAHLWTRHSIRTLLIFFTITNIFIIISVLTVFTIWNSTNILQENSQREMALALKQGRDKVASFIELRKANLDLWCAQPIIDIFFSNPELGVLTAPGVQTFFSKISAHERWLANIMLTDHGKILYDGSSGTAESERRMPTSNNRRLFENPEPSCFVLGFPVSHKGNKAILYIKRPFMKNNLVVPSKFIVAMIELEAMQNSLLGTINIGKNGFVFLLAKQQDQHVWIPEIVRDDGRLEHINEQSRQWKRWSDIPSTVGSFIIKIDNLNPYPLAIAGVASQDDIKKTIYFLTRTLISAGLLVLVIGIGVTVVLSRAISKPLVELLRTVEKIEFDKLQLIQNPSHLNGYTEVRILHQAFATMISKLIGSTQEIQHRNEELKEMGHSLRVQRNYLQTTLSSIGEGVITTDKIGKITFINPVAEQMLNCKKDKVIDAKLPDVFHIIDENTRTKMENPVNRIIRSGILEELSNITILLARDGKEIPVDSSCAPIQNEDGDLFGVVLVFKDISTRRDAEKRIRASEERFRILFENNPVSILLEDLSGVGTLFDDLRKEGIKDIEDYFTYHPEAIKKCAEQVEILDVNQTTLKLYEAETKDKFFSDMKSRLPPESDPFFAKVLMELWHGKQSIQTETIINTLTGKERIVAVNCHVLAGFERSLAQVLLSITDITEQKRLEAQLHQAQKMETIGTLAGGVAHDYNNMLSVILGYSEIALNDLKPEGALHDCLNEIYKAAMRSTEITRQLLAFARKQTISPKVLDLNKTVESMLKMLNRLIGENIELVWCPSPCELPVKMDPAQIDQILVNLCVNARDAITDLGQITIETESMPIDEAFCENYADFIPGDYAVLSVTDNGCGMNRETMSKIFDPFFTTKKVGSGTGMGLATVYGIVKQNNGLIDVSSKPGKGTTFKIYLFLEMKIAVTDNFRIQDEGSQGRGESILVVEDDAATLKMIQKMLSQLGYNVLTAMTPFEAISLAREYAGVLSLLITDVIMPEMNGRELAGQIKSVCPKLKHIYMSGYTANVITHKQLMDEGALFLQKPFSKKELSIKVKNVLDSQSKCDQEEADGETQ